VEALLNMRKHGSGHHGRPGMVVVVVVVVNCGFVEKVCGLTMGWVHGLTNWSIDHI
jgi:hypothetical protein